jgi:hypothetical protein
MENAYKIEDNKPLGVTGADWEIIGLLNRILKKWGVRMWAAFNWLTGRILWIQ